MSTKKARPAKDAGRAIGLNYLEDTGAGAGAGAGAVGQHEAAKTETAAAMTRNLTVFIVVFWLLVALHLHEVTHSASTD
jgi:preprotein translocase subunit SecG